MSHIGLADLLGVRTKSIHWERPQLFFAALFFSDLVWLFINPLYEWLASGESHKFYPPSLDFSLSPLLTDLLLAALATLAFRLLPYDILALIAVATSYGLLSRVITYVMFDMNSLILPTTFWDPRAILLPGMSALLFLGGLALAARWLKPLWLALLAGSVASALTYVAISYFIYSLTAEPDRAPEILPYLTRFLPFRLLEALLFALALWAGLRLTASQDLTAEPKDARLAKGFYLGTATTSASACLIVVASILLSTTFSGRALSSNMDQALALLFFTFMIAAFGGIVFLVLTHRMWKAIQDGHARTSPALAVGLLLVPLYNLFWIFWVYRGFAKDFNEFTKRHSINAPFLSTGLFTAYGALTICGIIPYFGWIFVAANFFVTLAMISKICDAVNSIPEKLPDRDAERPSFQAL